MGTTDENDHTLVQFSQQFRHYREEFPDFIHNNLDVLEFTVLEDTQDNSLLPKTVNWGLSKLFFEYFFLKSKHHRTNSNIDGNSQILIPFTKTCRFEYLPLLNPVLTELSNQYDIAIFTVNRQFSGEMRKSIPEDISIIFEEDIVTKSLINDAKQEYHRHLPEIRKFSEQINAQGYNRNNIKRFFKQYFIDKYLFDAVLKRVQPSLLYAVQYTSNRGYLSAIEDYKEKSDITNVVIQHGAFRPIYIHPFVGADHALLWGEHFERILERAPAPNKPNKSVVVGNPNLEAKLEEYGRNRSSNHEHLTLLYASTLVENSKRAMTMFAEVVSEYDSMDTIFKPHPSGEENKYNSLSQYGIIKCNDVVKDTGIYELFTEIDIVFGTVSTVLPEAIVFDTPAVQLLQNESTSEWRDMGLYSVSDTNELRKLFEELTENKMYLSNLLEGERNVADEMFNVTSSSQAIVEYIRSLRV